MSTSIQNPSLPESPTETQPRCQVLRRAVPPPTQPKPVVAHVLHQDDDDAAYLDLRNRAHQLAGHTPDFAGFLADVLTDQAWEFSRDETMRSAAMNLQLTDDRHDVSSRFTTIDEPTRQYLAWEKLAARQPFRELLRDSERLYRRIRHGQDSIHKAVVRRPR